MTETPEEFAQKVKDYCFDAWTMNREQGQYMGEFLLDEAAKLIASRDAQIRKEDAEKAVEYCESNRLTKGWQGELKAAIVGKEGEE